MVGPEIATAAQATGSANDVLLQLGVGGLFALFIIREVLNFLKTRNGNGHRNGASGERPVEYWQEQMRRAAADGFDPLASKLLDKIEQTNVELRGLRQSTHEMRDSLNVFIGKLTGMR